MFLGAGLLLLSACQKKEEAPKAAPATPAPPAVSIAPINEPEPATAASMAPAAGSTTAAAAPAAESSAEPAAKKVVPSGSVQACCSALAAAAKEPGKNQNRYTSAASVCVGLEKALKAGKSNLASTKVTLRAQLAGAPVPNGC
jgi:hypothetical protein